MTSQHGWSRVGRGSLQKEHTPQLRRRCIVATMVRCFLCTLVLTTTAATDKPRIAVVTSGSLRTFLNCNASFFKRVVTPNPSFAFDFYYFAVADGSDAAAARALRRPGRHPGLRRLELEPHDEAIVSLQSDLPRLGDLPEGAGTARGKATNVALMFRSIAKADALRRTDERGHSLVIRTRPDLRWCADLNLTAALHLAQGKRTVLVPFAEDNLVFDQVAVAAPRTMASYADVYTTFRDEVARNPARSLYPEREMWRHFRSAKLRPLTMRQFRGVLVRSGGRAEDSFTKLRRDHAALGAVAMPERVRVCNE